MKKMAFVFPGQGAQYVGMGQELAEHYPVCQEIFAEADARLDFSLSELMFHGPQDQLILTENAQPALVAVSVACLRLLAENGIVPDMVAGHSLGEYAALVAAGALADQDAIWLVRQRGLLMADAMPAGKGGMVAILGATAENVAALCTQCHVYGVVEPANYNCPGQIVVSGEISALEQVVSLAKSYGAKRAVPLAVSGAFHCSLLRETGLKLAQAIAQVTIHAPQKTVIANYTAQPVVTTEAIIEALVKQVSSPVLWEQTIVTMVAAGVEVIVEVGAGKVLSGLIKKTAPQLQILNVQDQQSLESTIAYLRD